MPCTRTICEHAAITHDDPSWIWLRLSQDGRKCSLSFAFRFGKFILTWTWGGYLHDEANTQKESGVTDYIICHLNFNIKLSLWIPRTSDFWFPFFMRQTDMAYRRVCVLRLRRSLLQWYVAETCKMYYPSDSHICKTRNNDNRYRTPYSPKRRAHWENKNQVWLAKYRVLLSVSERTIAL